MKRGLGRMRIAGSVLLTIGWTVLLVRGCNSTEVAGPKEAAIGFALYVLAWLFVTPVVFFSPWLLLRSLRWLIDGFRRQD